MINLHELYAEPDESEPGRAEKAILRAAIDLFGTRGYGATSVRQIATAAGVTPPLIAYHFASKEGLFRTCLEVVHAAIGATLTHVVERSRSLDEMVRGLAASHLRFPEQHPGPLRLTLTIAYGPDDSQPEIDFLGPWVDLVALVDGRIRQAIETGEFTPRPGADSLQLTRHLFRLLHMAVFEGYERDRCCGGAGPVPEFMADPDDPVAELRDQFFLGAGTLADPDTQEMEDAR